MTDEKQKQRRVQKVATGIGGGTVLIIGIICIPYPGPGWLIVFAGLAILAREYPWAGRVLYYARGKYDTWNVWIKKQHWVIRSITFIGTCLVVIATLWLLNGYGLINDWFNLGQDWVKSPFVR